MARKYDRYGRNRQFRRNPTRSRKFFPYQLPYQPGYKLMSGPNTEVSAATASRWRQVVHDITRGELFSTESHAAAKRQRHVLDEFAHHNFVPRYAKRAGRGALDIAETLLIAEVPPAAIPIMGLEMVMNPKRFSNVAGGGIIATTAGMAYLGAKNLI